MKRHPLARPLDAILATQPDVYAGLGDALLIAPPSYQRVLWTLKTDVAADLVGEAVGLS